MRKSRFTDSQIMAANQLQGWPLKRRRVYERDAIRPQGVEDHLRRDFFATEPETRWVTDITELTAE